MQHFDQNPETPAGIVVVSLQAPSCNLCMPPSSWSWPALALAGLALLGLCPRPALGTISCLTPPTSCALGTFKLRDGTNCRCEPCLPGSFRYDANVDLCTVPGAAILYSDSITAPPKIRGVGNCTLWFPSDVATYYSKLSNMAQLGAKVYVGDGSNTIADLSVVLNSWGYSQYGYFEYARTHQVKCGSLEFRAPVSGLTWTIYASSTRSGVVFREFTLQNGNGNSFEFAAMNFTYPITDGNPIVVTTPSFAVFGVDTVKTLKKYLIVANLAASISPEFIWANQSGVTLTLPIRPFNYWNQQFIAANGGEWGPELTVTMHITFIPVTILASPNDWTLNLMSGQTSSRTVQVYNTGGDPVSFNISTQYFGDTPPAEWLFVSNSSGALNTSCTCAQTCFPNPPDLKRFSTELTVTVDASQLPAGSYGGAVVFGSNLASTKVNVQVSPGPADFDNSIIQLGLAQAGTLDMTVDVITGVDLWVVLYDAQGSVTSTFPDNTNPADNTFNLTLTRVDCPACEPLLAEAYFLQFGWNAFVYPESNGTWAVTAVHNQGGYEVVGLSDILPLYVQVGAVDCASFDPLSVAVDLSSPEFTTEKLCTCPPGYGEGPGQFVYVTCTKCAKGTFSNSLTGKCERCPPNTVSTEEGATSCQVCSGPEAVEVMTVNNPIEKPVDVGSIVDLGTSTLSYEASEDATTCTLCDTDYVAWKDICAPCAVDKKARKVVMSLQSDSYTGVNGTRVVDVKWRAQCTCKLDYYRDQGGVMENNHTCVKCPAGAYCLGLTRDEILPLHGFFQTPWDPLDFQECRNPDSCPGVVLETSKISQGDTYYAAQELLFRNNSTSKAAATAASLERQKRCPNEAFPCATGFTGPGCFKCDVQYTRVGVSGCQECIPSAALVTALIIGILLAIALAVFLVRRAVKIGQYERERLLAGYAGSGLPREDSRAAAVTDGGGAPPAIASTTAEEDAADTREIQLLKVLTSHLQETAVTVAFRLSWPTWVVSMYEVFSVVSSAGQSLFSLSCLLEVATVVDPNKCGVSRQNVTSNVVTYGMFDATRTTSFFVEAIFLSLIPVAWTVCAMAFWFGFYLKYKVVDKKNKGRSSFNYLLLSCIVLLFLLYPTLTRTALRFFSCSSEEYAGYRFLESDFNVVCFGPTHIAWAATLGVLMVLAFAIGCPLLTFVVLRHHHKHLDSRYKAVYGFVFQGFKRHLYFWECVIMVRKLCFSVVAVLLSPLGSDLQAFAGLGVLLLFIELQTALRPYVDQLMNRLELAGLLVRFVTILLGLALDSKNSSSTAVTFFGVCIVIINAAYLAVGARLLLMVMFRARSEGLAKILGLKLPDAGSLNRPPAESMASVASAASKKATVASSSGAPPSSDTHAFENPVYRHLSVQVSGGIPGVGQAAGEGTGKIEG